MLETYAASYSVGATAQVFKTLTGSKSGYRPLSLLGGSNYGAVVTLNVESMTLAEGSASASVGFRCAQAATVTLTMYEVWVKSV